MSEQTLAEALAACEYHEAAATAQDGNGNAMQVEADEMEGGYWLTFTKEALPPHRSEHFPSREMLLDHVRVRYPHARWSPQEAE